MNAKDITNLGVLLDTLSKYLLDNMKAFKEKCPTLKDQLTTFKTSYELNPLTNINLSSKVNPQQCACNGSNCFTNSHRFVKSLSKVSFFLLNVYSHFGISSSPF
jgi:hypothetical protein